jgi:alpha-mannosidase
MTICLKRELAILPDSGASWEQMNAMPSLSRIAAAALAWVVFLINADAQNQPPQPAGPAVQQVVVVFKTHFDIGYTDMASNVVQRYRTTMIDQALKVVDQNRNLPPEQQFVWTIPGWPMHQILDWPAQTPERKRQVEQALKDGRFAVHALPFSTHTETLEPEDLVRGLGHASRLCRALGLELPRDAKMTDVPCHSWIMPTLLRHAGVDFLHLGCNAASSSPQVPPLFWWEGPDGSRLLTMYSAAGYGTGLVPPAGWPYKTWLALIHTGDNHGPPTPAEVKQVLDEAKQKLPGVKVRIGRLSDFADGVLAEKAEIPVVRGDMPDTWIHGPMSGPQGAKLARNIRPAIAATESLNTVLGAWGVPAPDISDTLARAYEQSLLYGEHTWGGAQYWVTQYGAGTKWAYGDGWLADRRAGRFNRLEASWKEHTGYIETARDLVAPLLEGELQALAKAVRKDSALPHLVVYNPLPWKRSGYVTLPGLHAGMLTMKPLDSGETVPTDTQIEGDGFVFRFLARDIPPMGYRVFEGRGIRGPEAGFPAHETNRVIESPFFRATLDLKRGALSSLIDKRQGVELVDTNSPFGFGQFLHERFDSNNVAAYVKAYVKIQADWAVNELGKPNLPPAVVQPSRVLAHTNWGYAIQQDHNKIAATVYSGPFESTNFAGPLIVNTRFLLYRDQPCVDVEISFFHKPADPWPEAGWLCLPFKVDEPQFRLGRQGSIVDPIRDIVRGANKNLFTIHTGLAIFDPEGRGVGVCPIDCPLASLDEPGCWKYSPDFVPKRPTVFLNLFNNQWTTNFRFWNEGKWTARLRLWSFAKYEPASALITPSLEARSPLQVAVANGRGGQLAPAQEGLGLDRKGVLVTAFGPNPNGSGTLLRLWELAGKSAPCLVRLPAGLKAKSVQPVDLRGRPSGAALPVKDNSFETPLRAFAPASFVLER